MMPYQTTLFDTPQPVKPSKYSWETSRPALDVVQNDGSAKYHRYIMHKTVVEMNKGYSTLKELWEITGIPEARLSARMSDASIELKYDGVIDYKGKRKKIVVKEIPL